MTSGLLARVSLPLQIAAAAARHGDDHPYGEAHAAQTAELLVPRGRGPHPVVVLVHGGSWQAAFGKWVMWPLARRLHALGYATWNVEYRRLGAGGGWPATTQDVGAAVAHLDVLDDDRLDLGRTTLLGHSAGGQLALWAAAQPALGPAPSAVVALAPVTRLTGPVAQGFMGATYAEDPARYAAADPGLLPPPRVPTLLVHPSGDEVVSPERSREYAARARRLGADVTLVEVGEGAAHRDPIDPRSPAWAPAEAWLRERR